MSPVDPNLISCFAKDLLFYSMCIVICDPYWSMGAIELSMWLICTNMSYLPLSYPIQQYYGSRKQDKDSNQKQDGSQKQDGGQKQDCGQHFLNVAVSFEPLVWFLFLHQDDPPGVT